MKFHLLTALLILSPVALWAAPIPPSPRQGDAALQEKWKKQHESFAATAKAGGIDVLLLGDSITNRWPQPLWEGYFTPQRAVRFGIEGDLVENLHWRVLNGEFDHLHPKAVVIFIGTNNVPRDYSAAEIAETVGAIVKTIQEKSPATKVLIIGPLPRNEKPSNIMRDRIILINEHLAKMDNGSTVRFVDLGSLVTTPEGFITKEVLPDFLHPNAATYDKLMEKVGPMVKELAQ